MRYVFGWRYRSNLYVADAGEVVELSDDLVEHINRDSPGVLTAFVEAPEPRVVESAPQDRMQRKPSAKRAPEGQS